MKIIRHIKTKLKRYVYFPLQKNVQYFRNPILSQYYSSVLVMKTASCGLQPCNKNTVLGVFKHFFISIYPFLIFTFKRTVQTFKLAHWPRSSGNSSLLSLILSRVSARQRFELRFFQKARALPFLS